MYVISFQRETKAYQGQGKLVTFERKVDYCLEQGFVSFLYERKRKNGEIEIIITANIFHELKRYDSRNRNRAVVTPVATP